MQKKKANWNVGFMLQFMNRKSPFLQKVTHFFGMAGRWMPAQRRLVNKNPPAGCRNVPGELVC